MNLFFDQYSSKRGGSSIVVSIVGLSEIAQAEVGEDSQEHLWGVPRRFFFLEMGS